MEIDYKYYAGNIDKIINEDFIKIRETHQMCEILKLTYLSVDQFTRIFNIVKEYFDPNDIISMLKCSNVNFKKDKDNYTVIKCISEIFEMKPLNDIFLKHAGDFHIGNASYESSRSHSIQIKDFKISQLFYQVYEILEKAAANDDTKTIEECVKNNTWRIINDKGSNCIINAARKGNLKLVRLLQEYGADPCSKTDDDITILHYFCHRDSIEGVQFALQFININATTKTNKRTPLHIAAYLNYAKLCTFLCKQAGIQKNAKDSYNKTPLGVAIQKGNKDAQAALKACNCI
ncbi:hypothetical protein TVAG_299250 [Trichomonas vaginalis G3]|uniref:Uncharacterized protein n=1 Tax=Trichomonas vaginalis (strain ATCC PRA-98 / G3) TaxID=412133 RepID=A2EVQ2_TRIV3|nr:temperature-gated cation channel protein [Trichomonas vaginalis G3]EAY03262.1 hypothetical protein TVAG_299250 [Trichomonas vaginalis G3]KAI5535585.1 temperature-gated cation channel protein [Trichomonas vaginalis G3]|eukprot:XP_001315485.1 hypothetical protein [Trichomonas vaginalis G3]